jgi:hypothetical protein
MRSVTLGLVLVGCAMGPNEETVIDELRVVSAVAEPPEVTPGGAYDLTVTVADPQADGFELLVFTCPPSSLPSGVTLPPEALDAPCVVDRPAVDDEGHAVVPSIGALPVPQWMVACAPGACALDDVSERELRDPVAWLQTLPLEGVSAAFRQVRVVEPPAEPALQNPDIVEVGPVRGLASAGPDDPVTLSFVVPGAETAFGRATVGGFGRPSFDVASDGSVSLEWYGPRRRYEGAGWIYVVFEGADGASSLYQLAVD